jgi:hypothetical protein
MIGSCSTSLRVRLFSPDGRLLFQPATQGIDVFDGNVGNLRARIGLPAPFAVTYDALVSDGRDNILLAITNTGNGIAAIDLTSIGEPPPLPYPNHPAGRLPRADRNGHRTLLEKLPPTHGPRPVRVPMHAVPHVKGGVFVSTTRLR